MPLRVTLIEDDELTTRGVSSMLREHPEQFELVRLTRELTKPIDIALYDHVVSATSATSGRPTLVQLVSDPRIRKVALFTRNVQPGAAADLVRRGASAYLSKGLTGAELVEALHAMSTDHAPATVQARPASARTDQRAAQGEVLTAREAEVLSLISSGLSNAEIASTLDLSVNSVKSYIRACYRKIMVDSRSKAVLWGLGHGYGGGPVAAPSSPS